MKNGPLTYAAGQGPSFSSPPARSSEGQPLAANVDTVAVVASLGTVLDSERAERMTAARTDACLLAELEDRFRFERASLAGISATFEVPDENLMALALDQAASVPSGS